MRPGKNYFAKWVFLVFSAGLIVGCGGGQLKKAIYLDTGFQPQGISQIVLLPAVDARVDKSREVDLQKLIRGNGQNILNHKGYQVQFSDNIGEASQIIEDDLKSGDPKWIKQLGPPEARHVMVLVLVDVTAKLTFGSTGNAEVAGFLFDKETGTIVWRDKGIGQVGQGGLLGMAMKGLMAGSAIEVAMGNLMASIPIRPS
jgi:hypothetical protein